MLQHIPLPVDSPAVDLVEQGHENEGVEDHGEQLRGIGVNRDIVEILDGAIFFPGETIGGGQLVSREEDCEKYPQLEEGLRKDVPGHGGADQEGSSAVGFPLQQFRGGRFCGQRQCC